MGARARQGRALGAAAHARPIHGAHANPQPVRVCEEVVADDSVEVGLGQVEHATAEDGSRLRVRQLLRTSERVPREPSPACELPLDAVHARVGIEEAIQRPTDREHLLGALVICEGEGEGEGKGEM